MTKIILIAAAALVALGAIIFCIVMTKLGWDFKKLSTDKYVTNTHSITETFHNISIDTNTADIVFIPTDETETKVVCYEEEKSIHAVSVAEDTLVIKLINSRKWYDHIGIHIGTPTITVYLPQDAYTSLLIDTSTGDIEIPGDFTFQNIDISGSTCDVNCAASVSEKIKVHVTTGDINLLNASAGTLDLSATTGDIALSSVSCNRDISAKVTTGDCYLIDVSCVNLQVTGTTGDIDLKNVISSGEFQLKVGSGHISFDRCDAATITAKTTTGDITGTLLSEKIIFAEATTGDINVPQSTTGGKCNVNTTTGDIKIQITE